ncbi:MAG: type II toxin-antitoxin system VapC family toxin, partial [Promethearchaeota archaeon]
MKFFIDSGVLIAAFNKKDIHHQAANKIITAITQNKLKNVFISDYIFDEVVTYIKKKYKADFAIQVSEAILNSPNLNILYMDERQFNATFHIFKRYDDLSFT